MASSREKPGNSPVKTKDKPERQSIEAGVGGVLMGVCVESGCLDVFRHTLDASALLLIDGVSITC